MPNRHVIGRYIGIYAPAWNWTKVTASDHPAHITRVAHLFNHFSEPLFIATAGCGREADQVTGNARFEQAEVVEDAPVAGCYGVVCFIDDHDGKLIRMKPCEASAIAGQCRYRGNDVYSMGGGTRAGLVNLRFQFWVDRSKLVQRLQEQFFPMRQHQQAFPQLQNSWEMREH